MALMSTYQKKKKSLLVLNLVSSNRIVFWDLTVTQADRGRSHKYYRGGFARIERALVAQENRSDMKSGAQEDAQTYGSHISCVCLSMSATASVILSHNCHCTTHRKLDTHVFLSADT